MDDPLTFDLKMVNKLPTEFIAQIRNFLRYVIAP